MPRPVIPRPLYQLALARCARNVHTGLKALDQLWQARPRRHPELGSPAGSPHNLSTAQLLPPDSPSPAQTAQSQLHHDLARELRDWLTQPPHHLAQDLVEAIIVLIEESVNEDRDRKLIKSLINIEHLKVSDIFFGIHGFFTIVSGTSVTKLPFGAALWMCLWDYEQIMQSKYIHDIICESLPNLGHLVELNLQMVASDEICFLISENLPSIGDLVFDQSRITDKGIKFLCGIKPPVPAASPDDDAPPSTSSRLNQLAHGQLMSALLVEVDENQASTSVGRSAIRQIDFDGGPALAPEDPSQSDPVRVRKLCAKLKSLSVTGCLNLSESSIWLALRKLPSLAVLKYHHAFSVAEIMNKELSQIMNSEDDPTSMKIISDLSFKLNNYTHPFPYPINPSDSLMKVISTVCPHITILNIVTNDHSIENFCFLTHLRKATIELADWFGLGLLGFLQQLGSQLHELAISCSSDPDYDFPEGGGQPCQLFNVGMKLVRCYCGDEGTLRKFSIAGSGLVSTELADQIQADDIQLKSLPALESLVLFSYDDDLPVQSCEERLLLDTLQGCPNIKCLSLEGNFSNFMTHEFIESLLRVNSLKKLRILDIGGTNIGLGAKTAELVLQLPEIHELRLSSWKLTNEEFQELEASVKTKGYCVYLTRTRTNTGMML